MNVLRLGTRGSQLALFQSRLVAQRIKDAGGPACELVIIKTSGDQRQDAPLSDIGGKRLFVKEIEDALLREDVDLAVHSSKDMPAELPKGLAIGAVLPREDPADALVLPVGRAFETIGAGARIGTGSVRRIAQLHSLFSSAQFQNVRGNLDTRLRKLDSGDFDLLVLAAAGLRRLGFASRISRTMPLTDCVPAPGQGIIAIEVRADDTATRQIVGAVNDPDTLAALDAERAVVLALGGGCQMPIGGLAVPSGRSDLELHAIVVSLDGARAIRYKRVGPKAAASQLGREVGEYLLSQGAGDILKESHSPRPIGGN